MISKDNSLEKNSRAFVASILAMFCVILGAGPSSAEYPENNISLVVNFAPGGASDLVARTVAAELSDRLSKSVLVENRGGAGGITGITSVARAEADGYTILLTSSPFVIIPNLHMRVPYNPIEDFEPIVAVGTTPNLFVVRGDSEITSVTEFIQKAKENPGKLTYSTPGIGTGPHLTAEWLQLVTGIDLTHIPYVGGAPAVQAVLAGDVDAISGALGNMSPLIADGTLKAIAQAGGERWPGLQEVPTLGEQGIKDVETESWLGIFAPKGTPKQIVDFLRSELAAVIASPNVQASLLRVGVAPFSEKEVLELDERVKREMVIYREIIENARIEKVQ